MPSTFQITLRDCIASRWEVSVHCDQCRKGTQPTLERLSNLPLADRPIGELFDAGKLTCSECGEPLAGLTVRRSGSVPLDCTVISRFWRPGSSSDPEVAAYWRGYREAKGQ